MQLGRGWMGRDRAGLRHYRHTIFIYIDMTEPEPPVEGRPLYAQHVYGSRMMQLSSHYWSSETHTRAKRIFICSM